jgi:hypothetical protein
MMSDLIFKIIGIERGVFGQISTYNLEVQKRGKIEGEIAGGIGKIGNLSEEFQGIETEGGKECAKENMGGKAMSEAGFGCWAFWNEVYRHGRTDGSGILTTNRYQSDQRASQGSNKLNRVDQSTENEK